MLFAAALVLKLAIDNHWIGPVGRILIGLVAGAGVVVWSERSAEGLPRFLLLAKGRRNRRLYLSLWAAFQLYHLLPPAAALGRHDSGDGVERLHGMGAGRELLAAYALAGGFATPLLLSTGGNHEIFLFTYLLAIDIATVVLVRLKPWPRLLLGAFPATVAYFIGWYWQFFAEPAFAVTTIFVGLFFLVFVSASVGSSDRERRGYTWVFEAYRRSRHARFCFRSPMPPSSRWRSTPSCRTPNATGFCRG